MKITTITILKKNEPENPNSTPQKPKQTKPTTENYENKHNLNISCCNAEIPGKQGGLK